MKISNSILAFLVAATAWADTVTTYAFFAKINSTLKPLYAEDNNYFMKYMIWGDSSAIPTEFAYKDGYAHSSNPFKPGNAVADIFDGFYFHKFHRNSALKLDEQKRLKNFFFYSCEEYDSFNTIQTVKKYSECFIVEVYFLPYDKATNGPVKGSYTPEEDIERIPHVFFSEGNMTLQPLYSESSKPHSLGLVSFNHGNPMMNPLEFFVQEDYAITESGGTMSGYVGFIDDYFGYGIYRQNIKLDLNENMKFEKRRFFSCKDSRTADRIIVLNPSSWVDCFEVNIYLLPYNRTSRSPMEGSYVQPKDVDRAPHVFFIKSNETLEPLSYYTVTDARSFKVLAIFFHQKLVAQPVEFTLENNIAYTQNTSSPGFLGLRYNKLVFGGPTLQTQLSLDNEMKIKDHRIYSCAKDRNSATRDIIFDIRGWGTCFEVELYLLPYNKTSGRPMEGLNGPDKDGDKTNQSSVSSLSVYTNFTDIATSSASSASTLKQIPFFVNSSVSLSSAS